MNTDNTKIEQFRNDTITAIENIISNDNYQNNSPQCTNLISSITSAITLMPNIPSCFKSIPDVLNLPLGSSSNQINKRKALVQLLLEIQKVDLGSIYSNNTNTINLDDLFEEYKKQGKLNDILDEIIICLEKLYAEHSNLFDHAQLSLLKMFINSIRKSKNASAWSLWSILEICWKFIESIFPSLSPIIPAVEIIMRLGKSIKSAANELTDIATNINKQTSKHFNIPLPPPATYTIKGELMNNIDNKAKLLNYTA